MLKTKSKFYKTKLTTAEEKSAYNIILTDLVNLKSEITIKANIATYAKVYIKKLVRAVRADNPGLFYVNFQNFSFTRDNFHIKLFFDFYYNIAEIANIEQKILDKISPIINSVNALKTPYDKEIALHDYLISTVKYENGNQKPHELHSLVGAILDGKAVCDGFAMAFKLLCDSVGISCIVVFGKATDASSTESHAWNIVKLSEKCYHVDVTWDACTTFDLVNYGNFNITDENMARDHTWSKSFFPSCNSLEYDYYLRNDCYFTNSANLKKYIKTGLENGQRKFSVKISRKFKNESTIHKFVQDAVQSLLSPSFLTFSYKLQYIPNRGVINIVGL
ncbi:MAG: hypothetical protein FWG64_05025 [Firmicutes bacterium]|nr:hypothetical protein [Bacillota bacterium]